MFWLSVSNMFIQSNSLFSIELYLGLFVFSGFVVYDTQIMIMKAERGSRDYLLHSLELYVDLVGIFVRIIRILQKKEDDKRRKKE